MSEKELRARIDRVIAEEERTYGRLIELRDLFHAITGELDRPTASMPNISNIVATPSRFRRTRRSARRRISSPATRPGASPPISPTGATARAVKRGVTRLQRSHNVRAMSACVATADVSLHRGEPPLWAKAQSRCAPARCAGAMH